MSVRVLAYVAAVVLFAGGALLAPAVAAHRDELPRLDAVVGTNDGFDIALNDANGKLVTHLAPGTYTIVVHDRSDQHNFHMASNVDPTVNFRTDVPFVGDMTFVVTFRAGVRYAYACEPHFQIMNGQFFIDRPASTTTSALPATPRLIAAVARTGATTLRPAHVRAGRVRFEVSDRSAKFNFHLAGPGVDRRTSRPFVGSATWSLRLVAGTYRYGTDPGKLKGRLLVP